MSHIVTTKLGRFNAVTDGDKKRWLWECPSCKTWGTLSLDQWEGRVSVLCTAPRGPGSPGYPIGTTFPCGYHTTQEYAKELVAVMQARLLFGESQWDIEVEERTPSPSPQRRASADHARKES